MTPRLDRRPARRTSCQPIAWLGLAVMAACAPAARAADGSAADAVTPYRPTVSNPAKLPVPGQLELEFGGLRSRSPGSSSTSLPYLLKLAFNPEWGVLVGGDAHVWQRQDGEAAEGLGSTNLTLKRAWTVDDATAFGAELTAYLPTGSDRVGAGGKASYGFNAIASRDLGPVHVDVNLNATRVGSPDAGASRSLLGASAAASYSLSQRWSLAGELSGTHQGGAGNGARWLAALTWSPTERLTFDLGIARAWRPVPGSTEIFCGVVLPIAKLW